MSLPLSLEWFSTSRTSSSLGGWFGAGVVSLILRVLSGQGLSHHQKSTLVCVVEACKLGSSPHPFPGLWYFFFLYISNH